MGSWVGDDLAETSPQHRVSCGAFLVTRIGDYSGHLSGLGVADLTKISAMCRVPSLLALMWFTLTKASPFGGWGPGEGFGHLGKGPPPENPNSNFGYDFFGTTHNRFNYSAVVMKHNEPRSMRDPKFVSVAAEVHHHRETYIQSVPKRTSKKHLKHKSEFSSRNTRKFRRGKSFPFKNVKSGPISKPNKLIQATNKDKVNQSKKSQPKVKHSNKFSKLRSRSSVQKTLSASDLWRMNRSSHQFNKTMTHGGKGRRDRKGRQSRTRTKNSPEKERKKQQQRPKRTKKKSKGWIHNRQDRRFNGRRKG